MLIGVTALSDRSLIYDKYQQEIIPDPISIQQKHISEKWFTVLSPFNSSRIFAEARACRKRFSTNFTLIKRLRGRGGFLGFSPVKKINDLPPFSKQRIVIRFKTMESQDCFEMQILINYFTVTILNLSILIFRLKLQLYIENR